MEAAGEPQRINRKVHFAPLPGNLHLNFAPSHAGAGIQAEFRSELFFFDGRILRLGWM